jgi:hypothetical protein
MREQTKGNAEYLVALNVLHRLAARLGWSEQQFEAARAELVRRLIPTLAEI